MTLSGTRESEHPSQRICAREYEYGKEGRMAGEERPYLRGLTLGRLLEEVRLRRVDGRGPLRIGQEELPKGGIHLS